MNKMLKYVSAHIPEMVCISVSVMLMVAFSVCAEMLENRADTLISNPLDEVEAAVEKAADVSPDVIGISDKEQDDLQTVEAFAQIEEHETVQNDEGTDSGYETYCIIGNGKKYHLTNCSYIKADSKCSEITLEEAQKKGYEPCSRCIK